MEVADHTFKCLFIISTNSFIRVILHTYQLPMVVFRGGVAFETILLSTGHWVDMNIEFATAYFEPSVRFTTLPFFQYFAIEG